MSAHSTPVHPRFKDWAMILTQANNKSTNTFLTFNGMTMTIADWSRHVGMPAPVISDRLNKYKWSVEKTLTTPNLGLFGCFAKRHL